MIFATRRSRQKRASSIPKIMRKYRDQRFPFRSSLSLFFIMPPPFYFTYCSMFWWKNICKKREQKNPACLWESGMERQASCWKSFRKTLIRSQSLMGSMPPWSLSIFLHPLVLRDYFPFLAPYTLHHAVSPPFPSSALIYLLTGNTKCTDTGNRTASHLHPWIQGTAGVISRSELVFW